MTKTEILSPPASEIERLGLMEALVRQAFERNAKVTNYEKGYLSVPFVNQLVDPLFQRYAADLIVHQFNSGSKIDKIVPVPDSGIPLATIVAERLGLPLAPGRKGNAIPGAWRNPIIVEEQVESFTTGTMASFAFNELLPDDRVLLVDDVIAFGYTSGLLIGKLRERGITVAGLAVYFGKHFQPGLVKIKEETGITPFVVVGIERITPEGEIFYSPPHF